MGCGHLADRHKIFGRGNAYAQEPGRHRGRLRRGDHADRERRERIQAQAIRRSQVRHRERAKKHGSLRFWLVLLTLIATAVIVTIAMFETLYYVMG